MRKREIGQISSNAYKSYRNLYNRLVRTAKTNYYAEFIERHKSDITKTWKVLNDIIGKRKSNAICTTVKINNALTNDSNEIYNAFCTYFTNIGQQCASKIERAPTHFSNYLIGNNKDSLFLSPITPADILTFISNLKSKASSDHDGISTKLVKDLKIYLAFPIAMIINNSLATGHVPDMVKLAKIIPIFKAKDKNGISNYRPISLLPVI